MKKFSDYLNNQINEGILFSTKFKIAKSAAKNVEDIEGVLKSKETEKKAKEEIAQAIGGKLQNNSKDDSIIVRFGNNSSVEIREANYGDWVQATLFIKGGMKMEMATALGDFLKKQNLF